MATIDTPVLLQLIEEYGNARARVPNMINRQAANIILDEIKTAIGPSADELAARYTAGESLTTIASTTGLSYAVVRSTLIRHGIDMRPQGRVPTKGRNTK